MPGSLVGSNEQVSQPRTELGFSRGDAIEQLGLPKDLARAVRARRVVTATGNDEATATNATNQPAESSPTNP